MGENISKSLSIKSYKGYMLNSIFLEYSLQLRGKVTKRRTKWANKLICYMPDFVRETNQLDGNTGGRTFACCYNRGGTATMGKSSMPVLKKLKLIEKLQQFPLLGIYY